MCKAKKQMQEAHEYRPGSKPTWPPPNAVVTVYAKDTAVTIAPVDSVNPIGIRLVVGEETLFVPWNSIQRVTWLEPKDSAHGADDVEEPESSPGTLNTP